MQSLYAGVPRKFIFLTGKKISNKNSVVMNWVCVCVCV